MSTLLAHSIPSAPPVHVHARGAQTYFQTHIQSRSPIELVVMLYDGALRHLAQAQSAMAANDLLTKRDALSKGMAIVSELQSNLNMADGGEIAERLDALYTYINGRCLEANSTRNAAGLDEPLRLLATLRSAWVEVAGVPSSAA